MRTETTQLPGAKGADTPGHRLASARWVVISLLASGLALAHAGSSAGQVIFGAGGAGGGGGVNNSRQAGSGGAGGQFFGAGGGGGGGGGANDSRQAGSGGAGGQFFGGGGGGGGGGGESGEGFVVFVGAEGGLNWLLNDSNLRFDTGFAAGLAVGLEDAARGFRLELEAVLRSNVGNGSFTANGVPSSTACTAPDEPFLPPSCTTAPGTPGSVVSTSGVVPQLAFMLNGFYDFLPGATFTPFVGAGLGLALVDGTSQFSSAQFAYQAIAGVAWNITPQVRLSLDARYFGTTSSGAFDNNNITSMLSISYRFAPSAPAAARPPSATPPVPQPQAPPVMPPIPKVKG